MFAESKVGTGIEMTTSSEQVDQDALETRTERLRRFKNCYFTILVSISVIGFAVCAMSLSQHMPQDPDEYTPTNLEYIGGFMFVIPILLVTFVYVRKYRNEITCCMLTSVLAFFAMGTGETDKDRQERDHKMQEGMAWEEQENRRKNQEA